MQLLGFNVVNMGLGMDLMLYKKGLGFVEHL